MGVGAGLYMQQQLFHLLPLQTLIKFKGIWLIPFKCTETHATLIAKSQFLDTELYPSHAQPP